MLAAAGLVQGSAGAAAAAAEVAGVLAAAEAGTGVARVAAAQARSPGLRWATGVALLRQALLWGAPATADLLMDRLMCHSGSETHARAAAFARLAHTMPGALDCGVPAAPKAGADEAEAEGRQTNGVAVQDPRRGLLHPALLSSDKAATLRAVLAWGRRWGAAEVKGIDGSSAGCGGSEGQGFAWRWLVQNAAGEEEEMQEVGTHVLARVGRYLERRGMRRCKWGCVEIVSCRCCQLYVRYVCV